MPEIPPQAVQAAAEALAGFYEGPDGEDVLAAASFEGEARAALMAAAPFMTGERSALDAAPRASTPPYGSKTPNPRDIRSPDESGPPESPTALRGEILRKHLDIVIRVRAHGYDGAKLDDEARAAFVDQVMELIDMSEKGELRDY